MIPPLAHGIFRDVLFLFLLYPERSSHGIVLGFLPNVKGNTISTAFGSATEGKGCPPIPCSKNPLQWQWP